MMPVTPNSLDYFAKAEAGGKGYNLYLMQQQNFNLPDWVIIGHSIWRRFINESDIKAKLDGFLESFRTGKISADEIAKLSHALIMQTPLPNPVQTQILDAYRKLGVNALIAVRSSAQDEDNGTLSFAGQLSSFLYVRGETEVTRFVKACWASAYNARCMLYRKYNRQPLCAISSAVILQTMVDADVSGVMFSADPTGITDQHILVNAVYGVGEGLVSDAIQGDSYWLDRNTGQPSKSVLVKKTQALHQGKNGQCAPSKVKKENQKRACLSNEQLALLWNTGLQLEGFFGMAQDIEWAIHQGQLYILQSRPVTTIEKTYHGYPNLWDNANIVESYGGITLPLSFTFALDNYHGVYTQFCEILGIPAKVVREMDYYLANMLGSINGRVYYNLCNWYKLVSVLPGFNHNRQFMEIMMGVGETVPSDMAWRIEPHPTWLGFSGKLKRFRTGFCFLIYHFTIQKHVDRFLREFDKNYRYFNNKDFASMQSDQLFMEYLEFKRVFLAQWRAPIINDFLCMIHFGLLNRLTKAWLAHCDANLQNDLLAGEGGLESAEPTKQLISLCKQIEAEPDLKQLIESHDDFELLEQLNCSRFGNFYNNILDYIERYGYRGISELKLEVKDLTANPGFVFACLKSYLRSGINDASRFEQKERSLRREAESKVFIHLYGWRKIIYRWSLKNARKALKNRENTRFARTRAYGVARRIFTHMGDKLAQLGIIGKPDHIFYLTVQEIYGLHQGTLTSQNLSATITQRQKEYAEYEYQEPDMRFLTRGPVYWHNPLQTQGQGIDSSAASDYELMGLGCCPGVVEATVCIVHSPDEAVNLDNRILVTRRTDPGWVPLFPNVSGILVERGSLLSHSAIVAREMGIPAVVGIKSLLHTLKDGMRVRMDGRTGTVQILSQ